MANCTPGGVAWLTQWVAGMVLVLVNCCGCGLFNPTTKVSYGPFGFSLENSKDVSIKVDEAEFNPETKKFIVKGLEFFDDASSVRRANVEQIVAINEQMKIHGQNIAQSLGLITGMLEKIVPGIDIPKVIQATSPGESADAKMLNLILKVLEREAAVKEGGP